MITLNDANILKEVGKFYRFSNGYYTFLLKNEEELIFEEVSKRVQMKFDLTSKELVGKNFNIIYTEILDDLSDDDFIIYRIEDLELI
jgi:hypothetical protein